MQSLSRKQVPNQPTASYEQPLTVKNRSKTTVKRP